MNGKYLFLKETVDLQSSSSSYSPIGKQELLQLQANLDTVYTHYKMEGFDEVYLSIIPNPATILQPDHYNGLIPILQKHAARTGMPFFDVYSPFSQDPTPAKLYRAGDSHWNNNGLQVWLDLANKELRKQSS